MIFEEILAHVTPRTITALVDGLGAALRHLPSGYPQVNLAWMWDALLAASMAAWLHQVTAISAGEDILTGHGLLSEVLARLRELPAPA
jgi:hypothetical protein